ncbi:MAG: transcriptional repressor [Candidatus Omnitrophica bacterium]|nr:transcriptional repressor [Candidatus Omnitrophota bacterium]
MEIKEIFNNYLKNGTLKITTPRVKILKFIKFTKEHFDADDIYNNLKENQQKISLASIYRTLALFLKNGVIRIVTHAGRKAKYEFVKDNPHHDHMICIKCGKIIEFKNDDIEYMQKKVCEKYNFILKEHNMELRGLCKNCYKKRKK